MKSERVECEEQSFWQLVFGQSKVNGAPYEGEKLATARWHWPSDTYLQRRRQYLKSSQPLDQSGAGQVESIFYETVTQGRAEFGKSSVSLRSN
ncbi:MAG: hypothetical protein WD688_09290 [Candidatus Binatia bacterium]